MARESFYLWSSQRRWWLTGFLLLAIAGCNKGGVGAPKGGSDISPSQVKLARKVQVAAVEQKNLTYDVDTVGTLEPERQSAIAAGVAGVVDEVLFKEGDLIDPEKTILVKIDQQKYEAAALLAKAKEEQAVAQVSLAQDLMERSAKLSEKRASSEEELKQRKQMWLAAKAALAAAKAERRLALINLQKSRVQPPYYGQINERLTAAGDYVKEETVIATIADISTLRLSTFIPELAAARVKPGDTLEYRLEALPRDKPFTARIMFISTVADPQTHMFACKAEIPKPEPDMKPGMFARVRITTEQHALACVVPEIAIRAGEQGVVVYVPEQQTGPDGKPRLVAKERRIMLGLRQPGIAEVLKGVAPGEQVVTRGSDALEDGTMIEILADKPATHRVAEVGIRNSEFGKHDSGDERKGEARSEGGGPKAESRPRGMSQSAPHQRVVD